MMAQKMVSQCPRCRHPELLVYQDRTTGDWWAFCETCHHEFAVEDPPLSIAATDLRQYG